MVKKYSNNTDQIKENNRYQKELKEVKITFLQEVYRNFD